METLYQNIECGNILTKNEMLEEARELYDMDDTNIVDLSEYYRIYLTEN